VDHPVRRFLRFPPDEGAVALIDPNTGADRRDFKPALSALVTDEALVGCGLVTFSQEWLGEGTELVVKVGNLVPLKAEIRWVRELGEGLVKLGVVFLE
jgi:hypothetical protein